MSIFKASSARRREVRKSIQRQRLSLRELLARTEVLLGLAILGVFLVAASYIAIQARGEPVYRPRQLVDKAQVARVQFKSLKLKATEQARELARGRAPAVYQPNSTFLDTLHKSLTTLPSVVAAVKTVDDVAPEVREAFNLTLPIIAQLKTFHDGKAVTPEWSALVDGFMKSLRHKAILDSTRYQVEQQNLAATIRLKVTGETDLQVYDDWAVNLGDAKVIRSAIEEMAEDFPAEIRQSIMSNILKLKQPTYRYDELLTEQAKTAAAVAVQPQLTVYEKDQVIVPAGSLLDDDGYDLLAAEHRTYRDALAKSWSGRVILYCGPIVLVTLLTLAMAAYIAGFRPRIVQNPMRGLALAALLIGTLLVAWKGRVANPEFASIMPMAAAIFTAVIVSVAYDQRLAMGIVSFHCLMISVALGLSTGRIMLMFVPALAMIAQLHEVRHRISLGRAGLISGMVAALCVWAAGLMESNYSDELINVLAYQSTAALVACVMVGFIVLGILPFIEKAFKVTTSMSLFELCDVNQPLLRRLAQEAPGTYNHSLQVGTLAEAAAEAIGADGLLARVGAYYHDVGKLLKPQYFVENQAGGVNLHDKLSPAMSLLILVGHVKDGIELAREYNLPAVLHHFIESHHGTTLVEYFFHAAKRRRGEEEGPEEFEYRYPGPKPQTKEAAVLMICDATESACRSMSEPTPVRIEQLVHNLLMKRLLDGQFAECEITLAELERVEQAITKTLAAIYHGRIAYPTNPIAARDDKERVAS